MKESLIIQKKAIDPRIHFAVLLCISCFVFFADMHQLLFLNGFALCYLVINGYYHRALKMALFLAIISILHFWMLQMNQQGIIFLSFVTFIVLRFSPIMMMTQILQEVPSGKLIAALQTLGISKEILITLSVTLRFFPIIQQENAAIQMSAKLRGLSFLQPHNWLHPLNSFEYTFVPLMMRTLRISDELAASAMTKGIEYPGKRTSIYPLELGMFDYLLLCCSVLAFIGALFI